MNNPLSKILISCSILAISSAVLASPDTGNSRGSQPLISKPAHSYRQPAVAFHSVKAHKSQPIKAHGSAKVHHPKATMVLLINTVAGSSR